MNKIYTLVLVLAPVLVCIFMSGCRDSIPQDSEETISNIDKIFLGKDVTYLQRQDDSDEIKIRTIECYPKPKVSMYLDDITEPKIVITKKWFDQGFNYYANTDVNIYLPREKYLDIINPGTTDDGAKFPKEIKLEELYSR